MSLHKITEALTHYADELEKLLAKEREKNKALEERIKELETRLDAQCLPVLEQNGKT